MERKIIDQVTFNIHESTFETLQNHGKKKTQYLDSNRAISLASHPKQSGKKANEVHI